MPQLAPRRQPEAGRSNLVGRLLRAGLLGADCVLGNPETDGSPEEEQEELAASVLKELRQRKEREEVSEEDPYSWLKVLRNAKLSGPEDASVTYEQA
jgi:hypothetical protein